MISQLLHQTDIHAGIYQFWYKQMSAEVACSFYAEFAINGTKQTADTHAIVGNYLTINDEYKIYFA